MAALNELTLMEQEQELTELLEKCERWMYTVPVRRLKTKELRHV